MPLSIGLFVAGTFLAWYVVSTHGWHSGVELPQVWKQLTNVPRAIALAGLIASAYGLGGIVGNLTRKTPA
jgi:hypothetical protein